MNCPQSRMEIVALLDDSLGQPDSLRLARHLESCPACSSFQREFSRMDAELASLEPCPLDPPAALWTRIQSRIEDPSRDWTGTWRRLVRRLEAPRQRFALAGMLLLLLCSAIVLELPSVLETDRQVLVELAAFAIPVEGNPFLTSLQGEDPSLRFEATGRANPFAGTEETR